MHVRNVQCLCTAANIRKVTYFIDINLVCIQKREKEFSKSLIDDTYSHKAKTHPEQFTRLNQNLISRATARMDLNNGITTAREMKKTPNDLNGITIKA